MNLEDFEKLIRSKGFGIAAMNHYKLNGKYFTYCVIHSKKDNLAFQAEDEDSCVVFDKLAKELQ